MKKHQLLITLLLIVMSMQFTFAASIYDYVSSVRSFSMLKAALDRTDLSPDIVQRLDSKPSMTLFAPSNDAFIAIIEELGYSSLDEIDTRSLERILLSHMYEGKIYGSQIRSKTVRTNLNGDVLQFDRGSLPFITDINDRVANVTHVNCALNNGLIHTIDKVLLPNLNATVEKNVALNENDALGTLITDQDGFALYYYTRDAELEMSSCQGTCVDFWPIFYAENLNVPDGLDAEDFSSFQRADGEMQTTYKGWPLYYWVDDSIPGMTDGEGLGNRWFVAKPDYTVLFMNDQLTGQDGVDYNADYSEGTEETQYMVDAYGRTLYFWVNDRFNTNNFSVDSIFEERNAIWPIYEETEGVFASTLNSEYFDVIEVSGRNQLTYKGWPMYYWMGDNERGDNKGVSVPSPGIWPVAIQDIDPAPRDTMMTTEKNVALNENDTLGTLITDQDGFALYYYTRDAELEMSSCQGTCVDFWPIFYAENLNVPDGLDAEDFSSFQRADGEMQTTYKGWPLYYWVDDSIPGMTDGEGLGNRWFVAKPDYTVLFMNDQLTGQDGVDYNADYSEGTEETQYMVDAYGRTLYFWVNDRFNTNNFSVDSIFEERNAIWPIYEETEGVFASTLNSEYFDVIEVSGRNQLTYKGWPMYYWMGDNERGDNKGVSVPSPGIWPVAIQDIDSAQMVEETTATAATKDESFMAYPNPVVNGNLQLEFETEGLRTIQIVNTYGSVVTTKIIRNVQETVYLNGLPTGVYYLRVKSDHSLQSKQLIIK